MQEQPINLTLPAMKIWGMILIAVQVQNFSAAAGQLSEAELTEKLKFYRSIAQLEVPFTQIKILTSLKMRLKSEGLLKLTRPDQVVWEINKPSHLQVKLTEHEVRIESGAGEDLSVQTWKKEDMPKESPSGEGSLHGLVAWLQLDAHLLSQQYQILSLGPRTFLFEPRENKQNAFKNLKMTLDSGGHLKILVIHENSGDEIQIQFGNPKVVRNLSNNPSSNP